MDFSSVCLDGMLSSSNHNLKHHHVRSASEMDLENPTSRDHDWRSNSSKMARTESYIPALMRTTSSSVMSDASRMETTNNNNNNNNSSSDLMESARLMRSDSIVSPYSTSNKNPSLPFYHHHNNIPAAYQYAAGAHKSSGLGFHGVLAGVRMSPFTATQWQELEHQALILRYIMAGVQVPPELLIPIRKTNNMNCNLFSNLSGVGSLRPNLGWGSFHLGFGNNADPEPGRCRRTDGKKWRCSRDAVPDQKYCERHMNRGRHRSRKPVEGQTQTTAAATTTATASGASISSATSLAAAAARSAVTPNNTNTTNTNGNTSSFSNLRPSMAAVAAPQSHLKPSPYAAMDPSATPFQIPLNVDRYMLKGDLPGHLFESGSCFNDGGGAWRASRLVAPPPPPPKTTTNLMGYETRSLVEDAPDFGLGHMNLLPLRGDDSHHDERRAGGGIRHFFDDWPMRSAAAAAAVAVASTTTSATATQLSISIPSDFSPASPNNKLTLSPLKLSTSRSDDPGVDVALGVGMGLAIEPEHRHRQTQNHHSNWIPIAWESPVGGPLAEVLNSTALPHEKHNNSSSSVLNLMTGDAAWDCSSSGSPRGDNSPTGVLQKTLGSLSDNSSTGSSPRVLKPTSAFLCDNLRTAAFAQLSNT